MDYKNGFIVFVYLTWTLSWNICWGSTIPPPPPPGQTPTQSETNHDTVTNITMATNSPAVEVGTPNVTKLNMSDIIERAGLYEGDHLKSPEEFSNWLNQIHSKSDAQTTHAQPEASVSSADASIGATRTSIGLTGDTASIGATPTLIALTGGTDSVSTEGSGTSSRSSERTTSSLTNPLPTSLPNRTDQESNVTNAIDQGSTVTNSIDQGSTVTNAINQGSSVTNTIDQGSSVTNAINQGFTVTNKLDQRSTPVSEINLHTKPFKSTTSSTVDDNSTKKEKNALLTTSTERSSTATHRSMTGLTADITHSDSESTRAASHAQTITTEKTAKVINDTVFQENTTSTPNINDTTHSANNSSTPSTAEWLEMFRAKKEFSGMKDHSKGVVDPAFVSPNQFQAWLNSIHTKIDYKKESSTAPREESISTKKFIIVICTVGGAIFVFIFGFSVTMICKICRRRSPKDVDAEEVKENGATPRKTEVYALNSNGFTDTTFMGIPPNHDIWRDIESLPESAPSVMPETTQM